MSKYGGIERSGATAFDDVDVARCYRFRPAYPPALYEAMLELSPGRAALLDLGCGTGKLAGSLADHFGRFDAELEELLAPHLRTGALHFQVRTTLTWGRPTL